MLNMAAKKVITTYLKITNPRYAILIDSPWGAGKTHFVKTVFSSDIEFKNIRYVSLNGVSNEAEYRRTLLKDSFEAYSAGKIEVFVNMLSKKIKVGDLGSFARDVLEEFLISKLPETLIFDDIERSHIKPKILLGLINDFVEYKGKRVILLVNSDEYGQKREFLNRKEKLIGRTLKIKADFDAAFPKFINDLDKENGKLHLKSHEEIIKSVFEQAGHQNLRLLHHALRECAFVLEQIEKQFFAAKEPMARFVKTYIALAMALAKGEISLEDLDQRDNPEVEEWDDVEDNLKGLKMLFRRHKEADIIAYDGAVISKVLCKLLFVDGYAGADILNAQLKISGQFEIKEENPLWKRIVKWCDSGWDELPDLVSEGKEYLFDANSINAGSYLLIANRTLLIERYGGLEMPRQDFKDKILRRIEYLERKGRIPAAGLGQRFGWEKQNQQFYFGGYVFEADDDFLEIINAMHAAQLRVYERGSDDDAQKLLEYFKTNQVQFLGMIGNVQGKTTYYRVPIFHKMSIQQFSEASIELLKDGKWLLLKQLFERIADRHKTEGDWSEELRWFKSLQQELKNRAAEHSRLASAQLEFFFEFCWSFKEFDETTNCDAD